MCACNPRRPTGRRGCSARAIASPLPRSWEEVVELYLLEGRNGTDEEIRFYRSQPNLAVVIELASAGTKPNGRRDSHQRWLRDHWIAEIRTELEDVFTDLENCCSFEALFAIVEGAVKSQRELMVYDTALRIGAFLGLLPRRVYLHRGAKEGASYLGVTGKRSAPRSDFPAEFQRLKCYELEDCLCFARNDLARLARGRKKKSA